MGKFPAAGNLAGNFEESAPVSAHPGIISRCNSSALRAEVQIHHLPGAGNLIYSGREFAWPAQGIPRQGREIYYYDTVP